MIKHAIQPGETSGSIARRYGITQQALFDANPQLVKARDRSGHLDFALAHFRIGGVINVPAAQSTPSVVRPNVGMVAPWVTATWDTPFSAHATYAQHYAGVLRLQLAKRGLVGHNLAQELNDLANWLKYAFQTPRVMFDFVSRYRRPYVTSRNLTDAVLTFDQADSSGSTPTHVDAYVLGILWVNSNTAYRESFAQVTDGWNVICRVEGQYTIECLPFGNY